MVTYGVNCFSALFKPQARFYLYHAAALPPPALAATAGIPLQPRANQGALLSVVSSQLTD